MKRVEDILKDKNTEIENIKAPEEMEAVLRNALNRKKKKAPLKGWIAAAVVVFLIAGYNFDALAYYGKKILGYDKVTYGSIASLNDMGKGQEINKSCTFSNGTKVTLDGIMFDDNELVAFYKVQGFKNSADNSLMPSLSGLKPFGTYNMKYGSGNMENENTTAWVSAFDPPAFYEKYMDFNIAVNVDGVIETGKIPFTLDRSMALIHSVKQGINKKIEIGGVPVVFDSITASPLSITVNGTIDGINEENPNILQFELWINGEKYQERSGGASGALGKYSFEKEFDGVQEDVKSIELRNIRFARESMVDKYIDIKADTKNLDMGIKDTKVLVKDIKTDNEFTYISVLTEKNVDLPGIGLFIDGREAEYQGTETPQESSNSNMKETVFKYKGKGSSMKIGIKVIYFVTPYDNTIDITK